jgi:ribosomal protein S4
MEIDKVKLSGTVLKIPDRSSIPVDVQEQLVVELYSK